MHLGHWSKWLLIYVGILACKQTRLKDSLRENLEDILSPIVQKVYPAAPFQRPEGRIYASHDSAVFSECDSTQMIILLNGLYRQRLWPLTAAWRTSSLKDILAALGRCDFGRPQPTHPRCLTCKIDVASKVERLVKEVLGAFDGFCLDCVVKGRSMNRNKKPCRVPHEGFLGMDGI